MLNAYFTYTRDVKIDGNVFLLPYFLLAFWDIQGQVTKKGLKKAKMRHMAMNLWQKKPTLILESQISLILFEK